MIKNRNESVLLFLKENGERERKVKALLVQKGIRIKPITEEMQGQTIGNLFSSKGFEQIEKENENNISFDEDIMIMKGFTRERMNEVLEGFRKNGIQKINLKAVVTEHNIVWKLRDLYQELKKEHKEMSERDLKQ